ncbi:MAG TPA: hypothetical protein VM347_24310 [Nonomuraea sp.]|nr:hypothetical protein [Nonomuraea sp.]
MACLQMILDHRDGHAPPLLELVRDCRAYGGYREEADATIKGLYYAPFAEFVRAEHDLTARVLPHLAGGSGSARCRPKAELSGTLVAAVLRGQG